MASQRQMADPNQLDQSQKKLVNYKPNSAEQAVIADCRKQGSIRGAGLALASGAVAALTLRKSTFISASRTGLRRFIIGVSGAGGFVTGVTSYQSICVANILALDNSPLADELRKVANTAQLAHAKNKRELASNNSNGSPAPPLSPSSFQRAHVESNVVKSDGWDSSPYPSLPKIADDDWNKGNVEFGSTPGGDTSYRGLSRNPGLSQTRSEDQTNENELTEPADGNGDVWYKPHMPRRSYFDELDEDQKTPKRRTYAELREEHRRKAEGSS